MKKIFATAMAVLTAAVMAGCNNTADDQLIEDISGDISVTAEAENKISDFPVGKWIETRAYIYEFDDKGNVSIDTGFYTISGTYKYKGDELRLRLIDNWNKPNGYVFSVKINGDSADLVYTDYFDTKYMDPYEPVGLMTGYMSVLGGINELTLEPFKNDLVPAEHEDLNGAWLCPDYKYDYYPSALYIFDGSSRAVYSKGFLDTDEFHIKNGYEIFDEEHTFVIESDDHDETFPYQKSYMLYGDKLYISGSTSTNPEILERYNKENISADYFNGRYDSIIGTFTLENGRGKLNDEYVQITVNGNRLRIDTDSFNAEYDYYFVDHAILLYNSEEQETFKDYIVLTKNEEDIPGDTSVVTSEAEASETEGTSETETPTEEKDGMRIAELKDIEGKVWQLDDEDDYYIWGKDQSISACDADFLIVYSTFENGRLSISFDGFDYYEPYTLYIKDDKLYLYYYDDPDDYVIMEKYHQPDFSLSDLDGEWIVSGSDISSDFLWGDLYIKNGKGTYIDDMDSDEYNAEIILDNDKITLILGENKWEYTTYFISFFGTDDEILYLFNDKDPVVLERY